MNISDFSEPVQVRLRAQMLNEDSVRLAKNHPTGAVPLIPTPKEKKRLRQSREEAMNKTEREFFGILKARTKGQIFIAPIQLDLASGCTYRPDFLEITPTGIVSHVTTLYEVKGGFMREDGWIKLKMAASKYPFWTFVLAQKEKGVWAEETTVPKL